MAEGKNDDAVLNVVEEQIARTYAQGFLGAVGDASAKEGMVAELVAIRDEVIKPYPRIIETLTSAFLDNNERVAIIDRVFGGKVSSVVINLIKVLSQHGRIGILRTVISQTEKIHNESSNRVDVIVRLAHAADSGLLQQIEETIRQKVGIEPILQVEIVPELVGGLEVQVGDTVFDGSVRTAFAKAHKKIVAQTIEAIETQPERFTLAS